MFKSIFRYATLAASLSFSNATNAEEYISYPIDISISGCNGVNHRMQMDYSGEITIPSEMEFEEFIPIIRSFGFNLDQEFEAYIRDATPLDIRSEIDSGLFFRNVAQNQMDVALESITRVFGGRLESIRGDVEFRIDPTNLHVTNYPHECKYF